MVLELFLTFQAICAPNISLHMHTHFYTAQLCQNSKPESFKKENQCLHTHRAVPMGLQSWIMPPTLLGLTWGCGSVLGAEPPESCSEGRGLSWCWSQQTPHSALPGTQRKALSSVLLPGVWWAGMVSCPAAPREGNGAVSLSPLTTWWDPGTKHYWTSVQPSQARIQYFITCYFQLCYWRFTATAKPSHSLCALFLPQQSRNCSTYLLLWTATDDAWYLLFILYLWKQWDFTFGCSDWWTGNTGCCAQLDLFIHWAWPWQALLAGRDLSDHFS